VNLYVVVCVFFFCVCEGSCCNTVVALASSLFTFSFGAMKEYFADLFFFFFYFLPFAILIA
jgi:hypothetical protein